MSLLCILKRFQNEHLDSSGFELSCVFLSHHPMEQRKKLVRKGCGEGKRRRGGPSEH